MQVNKIQNNTTFNGSIRPNPTMREHIKLAIQYASSDLQCDRQLSQEFFNTLKAVTNDGTKQQLRLDLIPEGKRFHAVAKYGKTRKLFTKLEEDVLYGIVDIGKKIFGKEVIAAKPSELEDAFHHQHLADVSKQIAKNDQSKANIAFANAFRLLLEK